MDKDKADKIVVALQDISSKMDLFTAVIIRPIQEHTQKRIDEAVAKIDTVSPQKEIRDLRHQVEALSQRLDEVEIITAKDMP